MYKITSLIVDLVLEIWQRVPGPVIHNLDKARMLKKIMWHLNVDGVNGDYFEFGVAHGHSMRSAQQAVKHSHSNKLGVKQIQRQLFGFDTFDKFIGGGEIDAHPTWDGDAFNVPYHKVKARFKTDSSIHLIKIDVNLLSASEEKYQYADFGILNKAAVILFDMDLFGPTLSALTWMGGSIQQGTFLIFDEFFSFSGNSRKGEARALQQFLDSNPNIKVRDFGNYGAGGKVFVVDLVN